ncbi:hypothetical protein X917_gp12 [Pseudomonas phage PPpW-4]|uniref:Uncharacterized protein n=1 Tax=Pseudomonas phage PPpW-4 TaxID=1279083 RepID=V5YTM9_9CAUD|nr:hypothetical protein X917_gp12 [Pseudomonas phage PPpW-4]BAO20678.1 hypothetical protein [Pseudomonas phage PPpW-4]
MERALKAQVTERGSYRCLTVVFNTDRLDQPVESLDFHRGVLEGLVKKHGDTFNWLFIGLGPTPPGQCPPAICFEILKATTQYLLETN